MKSSKTLVITFAALIVIGAAAALSYSNRPVSQPMAGAAAVSPRPAPGFNLELLTGETISLKDFQGKKPVVINFWASWCPPCRDEAPALARVSKKFEGSVEFIGVVIRDTPANALAFVKEFGITYKNGLDRDDISVKYGMTGIPETYFIDKQGQLVDRWIGPIDESSLTIRIQKLLK